MCAATQKLVKHGACDSARISDLEESSLLREGPVSVYAPHKRQRASSTHFDVGIQRPWRAEEKARAFLLGTPRIRCRCPAPLDAPAPSRRRESHINIYASGPVRRLLWPVGRRHGRARGEPARGERGQHLLERPARCAFALIERATRRISFR